MSAYVQQDLLDRLLQVDGSTATQFDISAASGTSTATSTLWWLLLELKIPSQAGPAAVSGLLTVCR